MTVREYDARSPQASEHPVELALAAANIGTWQWDPAADHVEWSSNFEKMHGFEPGAFGHSLAEYSKHIHPEDRERVAAALRDCANGGPDYRVEYRLISPDGVIHHVEASGCRILPATGRLVGVCRDISDRRQLLDSERVARRDAETSELHYRTLAGAIPQQVWTATADGALDFVNYRVVDYFGQPEESIIGAGWQSVIHPNDLPRVMERWTRSLQTGEEYEVEFRLRRRDGRYRWHLGRALPVRDSGGNLRWLGTNTDIDETKQMLALMGTQLEVAHLLIRARSLEDVADGLLASVCRNLGWTCAQLWVVDRAADNLKLLASWCESGCDFTALTNIKTMQRGIGLPGRIWEYGLPWWITDISTDPNFPRMRIVTELGLRSAFGFPLIVGGEVAAVLELFSDEIRAQESTVMTMAATFGTQIGQFIQRIAAENELSDALDRLRRLQGIADVALSHLSLAELLENLLPKVRETVGCDVAVLWLVNSDGELYAASTSGSSVVLPADVRIGAEEAEKTTKTLLGLESATAVPLLAHERLLGVLVVGARSNVELSAAERGFIDLAAQRLANAVDNASLYENARESARLKDRFISIASHELKQPMTGILGWTSFLRGENDPAIRAEAIEAIEESARMQARLVEDLLDSARIREGKLVLRREPCNLSSIVGSAVRNAAPAAEQRGVLLRADDSMKDAAVLGDSHRLQQVVFNLLSNAIKFTPHGKSVRTHVDINDAQAVITVKDEGDGIAPDFLPRIFDAFAQEERAKAAGGLGLGLHIVSTIVKMHGGVVEAHSEGVGKGSSFVVRLPLM